MEVEVHFLVGGGAGAGATRGGDTVATDGGRGAGSGS